MRPGQNRRMRGRNNNNNNNNNNGNRKAPNPLQRSYESNGPDVKVRGTAQHVAEKYLQLARDAQSSGDPVSAENYFQHAEHYYRILLAAQEQMAQQFGHSFPPNRAFNEDADDGEEEGDEDGQGMQPGGPQPDGRNVQGGAMNGNGYNGNGGARHESEGQDGQRFDRPPRTNDRQPNDRSGNDRPGNDRNGNRRFDRNDRPARDSERRFDRPEGGQPVQGGYAPRPDAPRSDIPVGGEQPDLAPQPVQGERRFDRPERGPRPERRPRRERDAEFDADQPGDVAAALPSFLTTPVRVPSAEAAPVAADPVGPEGGDAASAEGGVKRPRRRRSPREVMDALGSETDGSPE
ncbi:MAG: DUF4167 domain-containing protein [Methylobacterium sp.]|nr:DUF4167 domain-containing protein [Methylobacterium sp.]